MACEDMSETSKHVPSVIIIIEDESDDEKNFRSFMTETLRQSTLQTQESIEQTGYMVRNGQVRYPTIASALVGKYRIFHW